jgi:mRNA-degrading endonuclease RelE of RelBE toxin-antitoxin system
MGMRLLGFRETTRFTRRVLEYLGDESYTQLQWYLLRRPEIGDLIQAGGGIRKVRWAAVGKGKRGGTRVIYYLASARGEFFMLDIYAKSEKKDLMPDELKELRKLVEEWLA